MSDVPPPPDEVLDDTRIQYQAMTELSDDEYATLADDIRENGVLQPVIIDESEDQVILDGHHREAIAQHYDLPAEKQPAYVLVPGLDDTEKLTRAIKQNVIGRDTTDAVKSHAVKQYIEAAWERTDDGDLIRPETNEDVADNLGVSEWTVRAAIDEVSENRGASIIRHARLKAQEYYDKNPGASYREVSRQVEAEKDAVARWLKEDFDEGDSDETDDEQEELAASVSPKSQVDEAAETQRAAQSADTDEVREAAQEKAGEMARGETTPEEAKKEVETQEKAAEEERQREERETEREKQFNSTETPVRTYHGDFREVLSNRDNQIDHIITDPPYDEDAIELWDALGEVAAEVLPEGGFVVAYSGKAHLPAIHDVLTDHLNYYWQGIVRHSGPGAKIFSRKLRTGYKPILVYQKGELDPQESFVSDVIEGGGREKGDHDWQQAEAEAAELIERFTDTADTVCDPMCGSGTIGVACKRLQRQAVLIEREVSAIETTRRKVTADD
jgi:ParB-like chromosome segregation protein Spo0J